MTRTARILALTTCLTACGREVPPPSQAAATPAAAQVATPPRADVAMSGAPAAVASGARLVELDAAGNLVELRAGTNGWLCYADDAPAAPGDSPDCLDERWQSWFDSYAKGEAPRVDGVGVAYMLEGSLSPSNSDPFAATPPAGASWMEDGPHVMVIVPDAGMLSGFPTEHGHGVPYVMYAGTPYAHLMVPVGSH